MKSAPNLIHTNFTIEAWINPTLPTGGVDDGHAIVGQRYGDSMVFGYRNNGRLFLNMDDTRASSPESQLLLAFNTWQHVAVSYNQQTKMASFYINGVGAGSGEADDPIDYLHPYLFIGFESRYAQIFQGEIDEVRIWDTVRSVTQIRETMGGLQFADETDLVGYWNFDNSSPQDLSLSNNHGALIGDAQIILGEVPAIIEFPAILSLDGNGSYVNLGNPGILGSTKTIALWLEPDSVTDGQRIVSNIDGTDPVAFTLQFMKGKIQIWSSKWQDITTSLIPLQSWTHLAIVINGNTATAFVNGVEELTVTDPSPYVFATLGVGAPFLLQHGYYFQGSIDEVEVRNVALNQADIQATMNRSLTISEISSPNLVGYWNFDDGNHGTLVGNAQIIPGDFPAPSVNPSVLALDGSGYVEVNNHPTIDPTTAWTLEAWIKRNTMGSQHSIISKYDWQAGGGSFALRVTNDDKLLAAAFDGTLWSTDHNLVKGDTVIQANQWYHIAATFNANANQLKVYVNGELDGRNDSATVSPLTSLATLKIGARGDDAETKFNGQIDEVRIWNVALNQSDIQATMNRSLTTSEISSPNLAGYWHFDGGTPTDYSLNGNHGTLVGEAQIIAGDVDVLAAPPIAYGQKPIVVVQDMNLPAKTQLLPNYPNPFNPETWMPFHLAKDASVTLDIYDARGQIVRSIEVGHRPAAVYTSKDKAVYWDGRNQYGEHVASGVYFYRLTAGSFSEVRKMVILK